ncbi:hypothetical protein [Paenibacillus harenae]|uniref:hypothetical protein n=1 Tax=Paenibacillus harenae TaxID=306543 RepID=UPI0027924BBE|nr:hypothetical protein [Paenibacillus harenae]MDQ0059444.1 hypothetical protein [Paenibacillus harenae]
MLKKEILDKADALGIELNNKAIERYVGHGLIVGKRVSQGYSKGVVTQYHERTMEAIQLINDLKSSKTIKHQKDYIFILFWRGYPVQWDKLKERIMEFYAEMVDTFERIDELTNTPYYGDIIAEIASDEVSKFKPIGRPSKSALETLERRSKDTAQLYDLLLSLLSHLFMHGNINNDLLGQMIRLMQIDFIGEFDESLHIHSMINISGWHARLLNSSEKDFDETAELIAVLKQYWSQLMSNYQSEYHIPLIGDTLRIFTSYYGQYNESDPTWNYKFYILGLISSSFRHQLKDILSNPTTQEAWQQLIAILPALNLNSEKEVNLHG